jgi:sec-independent protein translocase protein TatA
MGGLSIWHLLIVALLFVLLFGKGKISDLMGDVAKGVKQFKKGMADDDEAAPEATAAASAPEAPVARLAAPAKKPAARKPAAKKPVVKKPAAKAAAVAKPAPKKAAPKKPAAKKAAPKPVLAIEHKPEVKAAPAMARKPRAKKS